jgi:hypothetical protein
VHRQLDDEHEGPDWQPTGKEMSDVEAYMDVFERIQILVEQGSVDIATVDRLYSYRVINLTRNRHIVREKLEIKGEFWSDFCALWRELEGCPYWRRNIKFLTKHDIRIPPEAPSYFPPG